MVQVECRVAGGGEDIVAGVASKRVVTAAVDADVSGAGDALHLHLEVVGVLGLEDIAEDGRGVGVPSVDGVTQVALQATGVVVEGVGRGFDHAAGEVQGCGAEVDLHVLEGTRLDAAATVAGREVDRGEAAGGSEDDIGAVGDVLAVTRHGGVAAIKDGRLGEASDGSEGPVPVLSTVSKIVSTSVIRLLTGWVPLYPHSFRRASSYNQVKYRCQTRKFPV